MSLCGGVPINSLLIFTYIYVCYIYSVIYSVIKCNHTTLPNLKFRRQTTTSVDTSVSDLSGCPHSAQPQPVPSIKAHGPRPPGAHTQTHASRLHRFLCPLSCYCWGARRSTRSTAAATAEPTPAPLPRWAAPAHGYVRRRSLLLPYY